MAVVLPDGKQSFTTNAGLPLVGGKLYTFQPGTATPKSTFTDQGGGTPNTNPVIADARGEMAVYWSGPYDVVLRDSLDNLIWGPERLETPEAAGAAAAVDAAIRADFANTSDVAKGDALVGVKRVATGSVATTQHEVNERTFNVFDFLSVAQRADVTARTNLLDVTTALQAAIDAAGDTSLLIWPEGSYKTTATIVNNYNRQKWAGAGSVATQIYFAPTGNDTCVEMGVTSATRVRQELRGFGFFSDDSTRTKIAIDIIDLSQLIVDDVSINGSVPINSVLYWSGGNSVGIRTRGREMGGLRNLFIAADKPIQISANPSNSISIDHFNFHNCYLIANANAQVTIDTGINLTQVSFTGYQSWVLGTSGLSWTDTTSVSASNGLLLENVRTEQSTDVTAFFVDIAHNSSMQNLVLRNCFTGSDRRGIRLRKVVDVGLYSHHHDGATVAMDVDATVRRQAHIGCFFQAGSTAVMTGQRVVWSSPKNPSTGALAPTGIYDEEVNATRSNTIGGPQMEVAFTVANAGTQDLGGTAMQGFITVCDSEGFNAIFHFTGTNHTVQVVSVPVAVFSAVSGTASMTNVFWNAGTNTYRLQNNRGASRNYRVKLDGSYTSF